MVSVESVTDRVCGWRSAGFQTTRPHNNSVVLQITSSDGSTELLHTTTKEEEILEVKNVGYLSGQQKGLFARAHLREGHRIWFGPVKKRDSGDNFCWNFIGNKVPKKRTMAIFANHTCCSACQNCALIKCFRGNQDHLSLILTRDLNPGDEIIYRYSEDYPNCACCTRVRGKKRCNKCSEYI